jgi:hypothetical protein
MGLDASTMAPHDAVTVEIWRDRARVAVCLGPDETGECSSSASSVRPVCAGAELLVRSAPQDCWYFTVSSAARGCPLAWLASEADQSMSGGFYGAGARGGRHTRVFGR